MRKLVFLLFILFSAQSLFADGLNREIHINRVFAEGGSTGGFYAKEGIPECKWGLMYINLATETGKALFALVLTAKTADQPVVRVDYTLNASGTCTANAIHTM